MPAPIITPVPRDMEPIRESLLFLSVVFFISKLFCSVFNRRFRFKVSNNQAVALFISEITYRPIKTNHQSISKSTYGHQVNNGPQQPGEITSKFEFT